MQPLPSAYPQLSPVAPMPGPFGTNPMIAIPLGYPSWINYPTPGPFGNGIVNYQQQQQQIEQSKPNIEYVTSSPIDKKLIIQNEKIDANSKVDSYYRSLQISYTFALVFLLLGIICLMSMIFVIVGYVFLFVSNILGIANFMIHYFKSEEILSTKTRKIAKQSLQISLASIIISVLYIVFWIGTWFLLAMVGLPIGFPLLRQ